MTPHDFTQQVHAKHRRFCRASCWYQQKTHGFHNVQKTKGFSMTAYAKWTRWPPRISLNQCMQNTQCFAHPHLAMCRKPMVFQWLPMPNGLGDPPGFHSTSVWKTHHVLHTLILQCAENQWFSMTAYAKWIRWPPRFSLNQSMQKTPCFAHPHLAMCRKPMVFNDCICQMD